MSIQMVRGYSPPPAEPGMSYAGYGRVYGDAADDGDVPALNGFGAFQRMAGCGCGAMGDATDMQSAIDASATSSGGQATTRQSNLLGTAVLVFAVGHIFDVWAELGLYGKKARRATRRRSR